MVAAMVVGYWWHGQRNSSIWRFLRRRNSETAIGGWRVGRIGPRSGCRQLSLGSPMSCHGLGVQVAGCHQSHAEHRQGCKASIDKTCWPSLAPHRVRSDRIWARHHGPTVGRGAAPADVFPANGWRATIHFRHTEALVSGHR